MRTRTSALLAMGVAALALAGCASAEEPASADEAEPVATSARRRFVVLVDDTMVSLR